MKWIKEKNSGGKLKSKNTCWLITLGMMAVFYLSRLEYLHIAAWLPRSVLMKFGGFGLVAAGSVLFIWARRILSVNYAGHILVGKGGNWYEEKLLCVRFGEAYHQYASNVKRMIPNLW